jgi:putative addiction module component (TIGR02574 family)
MSVADDSAAVLGAALALPREKREQLVRELIVSLDREHTQDPNYDRLWAAEIERRWSAYEHGEVQVVENDEALRRFQQAIDRGRQA